MRNDRLGFTLLELMIVVAIISTLVAISVPSVARSRTQAREAQVIGFLRQYHIAQVQFQAAGIKDTNGDGVGDFGTIQDLLDANIYASSGDVVSVGSANGALAKAETLLRDIIVPIAHADEVGNKARDVRSNNSVRNERDEDADRDRRKPRERDRGGDEDNQPEDGGASSREEPVPDVGAGSDTGADAAGGGTDRESGATSDAGAGTTGGGTDTNGGTSTDGGENGGSDGSGGASGSGPAFLQGVSSSLQDSGIQYGYRFQFTTVVQSDQDPGWYEVTCRPANPSNGGRGFYIDTSGVIRQTVDGTFPNVGSKPL